jgi:hypothetical protein
VKGCIPRSNSLGRVKDAWYLSDGGCRFGRIKQSFVRQFGNPSCFSLFDIRNEVRESSAVIAQHVVAVVASSDAIKRLATRGKDMGLVC